MDEVVHLRKGLDACMRCRGGAHNPQEHSELPSFIRVFIIGRWGLLGCILEFRVLVRV